MPLKEPGIIKSQYPHFSEKAGMVTSYVSPIGIGVSETTLYFGTSIYSSPGGLIDEILYYSRGFDTVLESSILMMAFVVASWVALHFTMKRREEERAHQYCSLFPSSGFIICSGNIHRFNRGINRAHGHCVPENDLNALILTDIVGVGMLILWRL